MKIVHSFWSKPFANQLGEEKHYGGWRQLKYHYISWVLSCLTFKDQYDHVELVTDEAGKKLLIDQLQLPYTSVKVTLDRLNNYPESLWAIGKLHAYSLQNEPFVHVDGDVFIWQRFEPYLEKAELIGQHVDRIEGHYEFGVQQLQEFGIDLPPECDADFKKQKAFNATNAGILGGNNTDFFKEYAERSFWFIDKHLNKMTPSLIGTNYALLYEQYLFSVLARSRGILVRHYLEAKDGSIMELANFMRKYGDKRFVHLLGDSKGRFETCREMELQLLTEYPEYYEKVYAFLKDSAYV